MTNLLAFNAAALTFGRFATLMALPWIAACGLTLLALRVFFRGELPSTVSEVDEPSAAPRYALAVLGMTVAGFVVTSSVDVAPAWAALGGGLFLGSCPCRRSWL